MLTPATVMFVVGGLLILLGLLLVGGASRYRRLSHRIGAFTCDYRKGRSNGGEPRSFEPGVAVYSAEALLWFSAWSIKPGYRYQWPRADLVVRSRAPAVNRTDQFLVRCQCQGAEFDLLMSSEAYLGLASWLEAAPPHSPLVF